MIVYKWSQDIFKPKKFNNLEKKTRVLILKKRKSEIPVQSLITVYPKISHDNLQNFQGKQGNVL